jgi:hypothetical protein
VFKFVAVAVLTVGIALSAANAQSPQDEAISNHVAACWNDGGQTDLNGIDIPLTITTDADGIVRRVFVPPEEVKRFAGNPRLRAFAERAVRATIDPQCSKLPLPADLLGRTVTMTFRFSAPVCIEQSGRVFCRPQADAVAIGPFLTCIQVSTGMICPPAPRSAYLRRLQDAVAGRDGAPVPAQLMIEWELCNDGGQWHDTPTCDRMFPDVRHPRPPD